MAIKFIDKVQVHSNIDGQKRVCLFVLRYLVLEYIRISGKIHFLSFFGFKFYSPVNSENNIYYLKVNRVSDYSLPCIQNWVNTIKTNGNIVFICDNKKLRYEIFKIIFFYGLNFDVIPSMRDKTRPISQFIGTKYWKKATDAHLTSFTHAEKLGVNEFWTIDADDTMFLQDPDIVFKQLNNVVQYSNKNNIDVFSLDMWRSRSKGRHWSLGVVYVRNSTKILELLRKNKSLEWVENFSDLDVAFNLDWFFTYLKNTNILRVETFYFENYYFIHWGNFIRNCIGSGIYLWADSRLHLPILEHIFKNSRLGSIPIADCICFKDETKQKDGLYFLENEVPITHFFPKEIRELYNLRNFGINCKFNY